MKLLEVNILNYKCIHETNAFAIDDITCLVGKNESGKTAVLQAISRLNPIDNTAKFDDLDFPRMFYNDYDDENRPNDIIITNWLLEDSDKNAIYEYLGEKCLKTDKVEIKKGYDNVLTFALNSILNYSEIVKYLVESADLFDEEKNELITIDNTQKLIEHLQKDASSSEKKKKFLEYLTKTLPNGAISKTEAILKERLPVFLYFANYDVMKGRVSLAEFDRKNNNKTLDMSDKIFESLLLMSGSSIKEIRDIKNSERLIAKLEGVSNKITKQIFEYWSQNKHLEVEFRFETGRTEDPAPFNSGSVFHTRIKNNRHKATVPFDDRSTGFVWFFSFLVWFSNVKDNFKKDIILLLDEPGLNLHAKAQSDLLRYFKEKLAPCHQVIYTTHSPFMIPPSNLLSVRLVEDVNKDDEVLGTKINSEILRTDRDTIFPLQAALGYEIAQTLFVGKNVLLVEGPSDILYLYWASDQIRKKKGISLNSNWTIAPGGGLDKIASFISLFAGKGIHIAVLTDFGSGDKKAVERLKASEVLRSGSIFTVNSYTGEEEADVEDLFGRQFYVNLVNSCYSLKGKNALPKEKPADAPGRVVKEVEKHFMVLPPDVEEFNHYTPSRYLTEKPDFKVEAVEIDDILQRFEKLFEDINKLIV